MYNSKILLSTFIILITCLFSCKSDKEVNDHLEKPEINKKAFQSYSFLDSLNSILDAEMDKKILPGFAMSIFTSDTIFFMKGYGYADLESKKPYDENTVQNIASISKTLISLALMNAVEDKKIGLDDDINSILPFQVINPYHRNIPITIRHLATHTSSINDDGNYRNAYVFSEKLDESKFPVAWKDHIKDYNSNKEMSMAEFFNKVFKKGQAWETDENFYKEEPGTTFEYSNIGAALLAYCIELKTGIDYKTYTKDLILKPLEMNRTGWDYLEVDHKNHITYYNESYNAVPSYFAITYPDGGLFTSVSDLTIYMQEIIKGYQGNGTLVSSESYKEMMTNQIPKLDTPTGIIWDMDTDCCIGHGGNDFGVSALAYFNPDNGIGKILFSNIAIETEELGDQFYSIFNMMFKYDNQIKEAEK